MVRLRRKTQVAVTAEVDICKRPERSGALHSYPVGGDVSTYFRCDSSAYLKLAVAKHHFFPEAPHFGMLPCATNEVPKRLPGAALKIELDEALIEA